MLRHFFLLVDFHESMQTSNNEFHESSTNYEAVFFHLSCMKCDRRSTPVLNRQPQHSVLQIKWDSKTKQVIVSVTLSNDVLEVLRWVFGYKDYWFSWFSSHTRTIRKHAGILNQQKLPLLTSIFLSTHFSLSFSNLIWLYVTSKAKRGVVKFPKSQPVIDISDYIPKWSIVS